MNTTTQNKRRYALQSPAGQWASFDMGRGPWLTESEGLRYTFESAEQAEQQRRLYEEALGVALCVREVGL